jgi:glucosamine--fructose-6-phosphate aminotransferase (isomerizing)
MCGIVAVLGRHEVAPLILEALKRLEYRGYDSAGIATLHDGALHRRRAVGKLIALSDLLVRDPIRGHAGIGHTRWATHGQPTERNAHPHRAGGVAVVHNGIIENFRALRAELEADGAVFETETDTEVVVHLCNRALGAGLAPVEAARATLARLDGAFALCFLFEGHDDLLVAARRGSPLAVGYGEGETYVGSDALALAPFTHRIAYLDEGDLAVLTRASVAIFDAHGAPAHRDIVHVPLDTVHAEKGPYKHFMAKEMHEQPQVIAGADGLHGAGRDSSGVVAADAGRRSARDDGCRPCLGADQGAHRVRLLHVRGRPARCAEGAGVPRGLPALRSRLRRPRCNRRPTTPSWSAPASPVAGPPRS